MPPQVEKTSVNITLYSVVIVALAIGGATYGAGQKVAAFESRVCALEADGNKIDKRVAACENDNHANELKLVEISTDIKNISATLIKIEKKL